MPRIDRWQKPIDDFDGLRTGDIVKVAMGGGTEKGRIVSRQKDYVTVSVGRKTIAVWDARSILRV
jgi:hypothetical protein